MTFASITPPPAAPHPGLFGWFVATRPARALARFYLVIRRRPLLGAFGFVLYLAGLGFLAPLPATAADGQGPAPTGFGDLLKGPELHDPNTPGATLFEYYGMTAYYFDMADMGLLDAHHYVINGIASAFMLLTVAVVRGAIVLTWWMFDFSSTNELAGAVSGSIGDVATSLMAWLLPSALAIGALVAYGQTRGTQAGGFSQILWVISGGVLAVSFAVSPNVWVDTITDVRTIGSNELMGATGNAITQSQEPFTYTGAAYDSGQPSETMLRKSGDAIWRTYVVTPWCIAEFGSAAACERYGKGILDVGTSAEDRTAWIEDSAEGHPGEYDKDGALYQWASGKNSFDRLGIAVVAFIVALTFAILLITVSATATMAFISAILLLFAGVVFTMLWCIPGKPREWGNNWLEMLVGLVIQSILGTLIVGATLIMTAAAFQIAGAAGWGLAAGLSILVAFAAFGMRRALGTIMQAITPGRGMTGILGALAIRSTTRMFSRGFSRVVGGTARGAGRGVAAAGRGLGAGISRVRGGGAGGKGTQPASGRNAPNAVPGGTGASRRYRNAKPPAGSSGSARQTPAGRRVQRASAAGAAGASRGSGARGSQRTQGSQGSGTARSSSPQGSRRLAASSAPRLRQNPPAPGGRRYPQSPLSVRKAANRARTRSSDGMLKPRREPLTRHPRMAPKTTPPSPRTGGRK